MELTFISRRGGGIMTVNTQETRLARLRKRVSTWADVINDLNKTQKIRLIGVMLTYRPSEAWGPKHISDYIRVVSKFAGDALLAYAWVAELQQRGAVHYHVCLVVKSHVFVPAADMPYPDPKTPGVQKPPMWSHGWSGTKTIYNVSGRYLMKYVQKGSEVGTFPKGLRLFSVVVRCSLPPDSKFFFKLSAAVSYVRRAIMRKMGVLGAAFAWDGWKWRALEGGGWMVTFKRFWFVVESEWEYAGLGGLYD